VINLGQGSPILCLTLARRRSCLTLRRWHFCAFFCSFRSSKGWRTDSGTVNKPEPVRYHHFYEENPAKSGVGGMGAAHLSPSQPPEVRFADRGGEDRGGEVPAPWRPQKGPGSPRTGGRKAQIPESSLPALLKPESVFQPSTHFGRANAGTHLHKRESKPANLERRRRDFLMGRSLLTFSCFTRL
jgi:hypothetical protein